MSSVRPYYDADGITIYHGDCREVLPTLAPVDLLLTDPPYGIGFAAQPTKWQRRAGMKPETWDDSTSDALGLAMKMGAHQVVWGGNYYQLPLVRCWLAWVKPDSPPSMGSMELAWTSYNRPARHMVRSISRTNQERLGHPTQKPLDVIKWCISLCPDEPKTILDPFMGSGTTLRAAKDMGRQCIGIEREERYCEMAAQRLAQGVLF